MSDESATLVADDRLGARDVLRRVATWAWAHSVTLIVVGTIVLNRELPR